MPTYEYRCTECGEQLEVVQSFSDDPLTVCPACKGKLRKLFSPVGVVFKGSGFYKTDSRSGKSKTSSGTSSNGSDASSGTSDSGSSSTGSDSKSDTKTSTPATTTPSTSSGGSDSTGGGSKVA